MTAPDKLELVEDRIPLEGIGDRAADVIRIFGGEISSQSAQAIRFTLPARRGVAAAGTVECTLRWSEDEGDEGTVTLSADRDIEAPKGQRIALLAVGTVGALLWLLWPFYPALGALSWIGAIIAFATYFLTLRRSRGGMISSLLQQIAAVQRQDER